MVFARLVGKRQVAVLWSVRGHICEYVVRNSQGKDWSNPCDTTDIPVLS